MSAQKPYAAAMLSFLDRDKGTERVTMCYPITRIELHDITPTGVVKTRTFIAEGEGTWRELLG